MSPHTKHNKAHLDAIANKKHETNMEIFFKVPSNSEMPFTYRKLVTIWFDGNILWGLKIVDLVDHLLLGFFEVLPQIL